MLVTPVRAGLSSPGAASIATPVVCFQMIGSNGGLSGVSAELTVFSACKDAPQEGSGTLKANGPASDDEANRRQPPSTPRLALTFRLNSAKRLFQAAVGLHLH